MKLLSETFKVIKTFYVNEYQSPVSKNDIISAYKEEIFIKLVNDTNMEIDNNKSSEC